MTRRFIILTLLLLLLLPSAPAQAQSAAPIDVLSVDLWPDYDQQAVLVLLTGTLSQPGAVTIPVPVDADFHVLARIDSEGVMIDDLAPPTFADGQMTFTTPDLRFRVEYYMPYSRDGSQRTFAYTWQSRMPVNQLLVSVQQPAVATNMTITPEAAGSVQNQDDGLIYYNLPAQSVAAGETAVFQVDYTMASDTLTSVGNPPPVAANPGTPDSALAADSGVSPWVLALGAAGLVLIAAAATWQVATRSRNTRRKPKPRPSSRSAGAGQKPGTRTAKAAPSKRRRAAKFCHECGEPAQSGDRFCRHCGATLKA